MTQGHRTKVRDRGGGRVKKSQNLRDDIFELSLSLSLNDLSGNFSKNDRLFVYRISQKLMTWVKSLN